MGNCKTFSNSMAMHLLLSTAILHMHQAWQPPDDIATLVQLSHSQGECMRQCRRFRVTHQCCRQQAWWPALPPGWVLPGT
jgi:hypothetical protein